MKDVNWQKIAQELQAELHELYQRSITAARRELDADMKASTRIAALEADKAELLDELEECLKGYMTLWYALGGDGGDCARKEITGALLAKHGREIE